MDKLPLQRNGYTFAIEGAYYVIIFDNEVIFRDASKRRVEAHFLWLVECSNRGETRQ